MTFKTYEELDDELHEQREINTRLRMHNRELLIILDEMSKEMTTLIGLANEATSRIAVKVSSES